MRELSLVLFFALVLATPLAAQESAEPTKDFKVSKQWVVVHMSPENALLQVDSVSARVRSETVEMYLPVGEHSYLAQAPFYEPLSGSFTLTDSVRTDISVDLQPFYSDITVRTEWAGGDFFIDGRPVTREEATSYRLNAGNHRLSCYWGEKCYFDSLVFVGPAEKKVLDLKMTDLWPWERRREDPLSVSVPPAAGAAKPAGAPVKLIAADEQTEIWIDREKAGTGQWEGNLGLGFHLVQSFRDGSEPLVTRLWIDDDTPQEVSLPAYTMAYGLLNVHCNVPAADIFIDGESYGQTPQIIRLPVSRGYSVTLSKQGYRDKRKKVRPVGNQELDVYLKMKKK